MSFYMRGVELRKLKKNLEKKLKKSQQGSQRQLQFQKELYELEADSFELEVEMQSPCPHCGETPDNCTCMCKGDCGKPTKHCQCMYHYITSSSDEDESD